MLKVVPLVFSLFALLIPMPNASASSFNDVGRVSYVSGDAYVVRGAERLTLAKGDTVMATDTVMTGTDGRVALEMYDESKIHVGRLSRVTLSDYTLKDRSLMSGAFNVLWGKVRFLVSKLSSGSSFEVHTKTAVLGVRGTEFVVIVPLPEGVDDPLSIDVSPNLPALITTVYGIEGLVEGVSLKGERVLIGAGVKVDFSAENRAVIRFDNEPADLPKVGAPAIGPGAIDVPTPADIPVPPEPVLPPSDRIYNITPMM